MTSLRLVVAGSPEAAVPTLEHLQLSRHEIVRVITRPATPQGRRRILTPTPVAEAASHHGLSVVEATRLGDLDSELLPVDVDLGVIVAYGGLVRAPLLHWPRLGWINLHFSLLPRWRGAAPVQHSIIAGDSTTGATVFQLTEGLDEGDWYAQLTTPIGAQRTSGALLEELAVSGAALVGEVVDSLADGTARAHPQVGEPTFAPKLTRADARVDWTESADRIHARVRGVTPEPGAFTLWDETPVKILEAAISHDGPPVPPGVVVREPSRVLVGTSTSPIQLLRVQPAGKSAMLALDWSRGLPSSAVVVFS